MRTEKTKVQVADLSGAVLDWAVAVAEGKDYSTNREWGNALINHLGRCSIANRNWSGAKYFEPSKNWGHGGPIIERENISLSPPTSSIHRNGGPKAGWGPSGRWTASTWHAGVSGKRSIASDKDSPLVVAMRCYVASKMGAEIDVPAYILEPQA